MRQPSSAGFDAALPEQPDAPTAPDGPSDDVTPPQIGGARHDPRVSIEQRVRGVASGKSIGLAGVPADLVPAAGSLRTDPMFVELMRRWIESLPSCP